jgi:6-pyruvoyltetrahydropterin/6-carboxytetrahydropterin synthase
MLTRIAKDFRWEMAHRLPEHDGGCRNVHGHSYRLWVEIAGEPQANGMVLDYFDLKKLVDPMIAEIDHAFLCDRSDKVICDFMAHSGLKAVYVDWPSTAENICRWFFERITKTLGPMKHLSELRVRIQETERTYAEVSGTL